MSPKWPTEILIVRHGQSEANIRKEAAKAARATGTQPESAWAFVHERDQDTRLSKLGARQALGLGRYLRHKYPVIDTYKLHPVCRPPMLETIILSPYIRTRDTTDWIVSGLGYIPELVVEERIREIEFGIMDGLTREGVRLKYPDEATRRERDGKYWYRPPGGESRPDVRLRCHSIIGTLTRDYVGKRILLVCHSVVVLAIRSLLERWGEEEYMKVDAEDDVLNCGLTRYVCDPNSGKLVLAEYNTVAPIPERL